MKLKLAASVHTEKRVAVFKEKHPDLHRNSRTCVSRATFLPPNAAQEGP